MSNSRYIRHSYVSEWVSWGSNSMGVHGRPQNCLLIGYVLGSISILHVLHYLQLLVGNHRFMGRGVEVIILD